MAAPDYAAAGVEAPTADDIRTSAVAQLDLESAAIPPYPQRQAGRGDRATLSVLDGERHYCAILRVLGTLLPPSGAPRRSRRAQQVLFCANDLHRFFEDLVLQSLLSEQPLQLFDLPLCLLILGGRNNGFVGSDGL